MIIKTQLHRKKLCIELCRVWSFFFPLPYEYVVNLTNYVNITIELK